MNLTNSVLDKIIDRLKTDLAGEKHDSVTSNVVEEPVVEMISKPVVSNSVGEFVHLHVHTDYSMLDGMCKIDHLIKRAVELGMPAIAMTDHGNMSGAIELYKSAKKAGIKPIVGCEVYCVPDMSVKESRDMWHLVLLAKDVTGYQNLMKITSAGFRDGFYYKPRVDLSLIS